VVSKRELAATLILADGYRRVLSDAKTIPGVSMLIPKMLFDSRAKVAC
jgi:hypothetical protein